MNIIDALEEQARRRPTANCIYHHNQYYTYRETYALTANLAHRFKNLGIGKGDVVAQTFFDELNEFIAILATAMIGATVFSLPASLPQTRRRTLADNVNASIFLSDSNIESDFMASSFRVTLEGIESTPPNKIHKVENPANPWVIVTGSGSTGRPKYLPVFHNQQLARMKSGADWLPYGENDTIHSMIRLDFFATKQRYLEAISLGACTYLKPSREGAFLQGISEGKLSVLYGTVFHIEKLLRRSSPRALGIFSKLNALMVGGSSVSTRLRNSIRDSMTSRLFVLYGSNESNTTTITSLETVFDVEGSVGRPFKNHHIEIVDSNDKPVATGCVGQIRLRNSGMISGYLNDVEATNKHFRDGWFYPRDTGKIDSQGEVICLGREDNMMNMNGINIYPLELETALLSHPGVQDALAIPIKNSAQQDIPVCLAKVDENNPVTEPQLLTFTKERLGPSSPHRIFLVPTIPRNEQGKPVLLDIHKLVNQNSIARQGQLQGRFQNRFSIPDNAEMPLLDRWLEDVWLNDTPLYPSLFCDTKAAKVPAVFWLIRCLNLARLLMQECSMPVFALPKVLDCRQDDTKPDFWVAQFTLPVWEYYPDKAYKQVLTNAFELAAWMSTTTLSNSNIAECINQVEKNIIEPTRKIVSRGKSNFPILKSAHAMGIPFRHIGKGTYQLGLGSKSLLLDRSTTENDSAIGARISSDKSHTTNLLQSAALPAPQHSVVADFEKATQVADKLGWPVVVKPVDGERGEGVSTQIFDYAHLQRAFNFAMENSKQKTALVERQVQGVCHRLFIADGELLYAVKRLPPAIIGDGTHRIRELIEAQVNLRQLQLPSRRVPNIPMDRLTLNSINRQGYDIETVLPHGETLALREIETTRWGGIDEDVTNTIHPDNVKVAKEAAQLFRLQVAGVDIISTDITKPWHQNHAIINEVNYSPLLGGGPISMRHIPKFLHRLVPDSGSIIVDVIVGGDVAWQVATQKHRSLCASGTAAFLTNHDTTINSEGNTIALLASTLFARSRALTLHTSVEHLVIVVQTDEFLHSGLPFNILSSLTVVDSHLKDSSDATSSVEQQKVERLLLLLKEWKETSQAS